MSAIDSPHVRLQEFRDWVQSRLESREDPSPIWYRYYQLREALDAVLVHSVSPASLSPPPFPVRKQPSLRLVIDHDDGDPRR
jgi:hypothetical protein